MTPLIKKKYYSNDIFRNPVRLLITVVSLRQETYRLSLRVKFISIR